MNDVDMDKIIDLVEMANKRVNIFIAGINITKLLEKEKRKKEEQTDKTNASISAENMEKLHFSMGITRTHSIRSHALYMKFYKNSPNTN